MTPKGLILSQTAENPRQRENHKPSQHEGGEGVGGGGVPATSQKQINYEKDFAPEAAQPGEEETRHRGPGGRG